MLLEACNAVGADVPFFCYHAGLSSPAVCRQCLVDVKGQPKPVPSCYTPVADKMEVMTKSPRALDVRRQMLEFTLVNHPIDCPICDKAGECLLQKHYFDWDAKLARNDGIKVKKDKVVDVGPHIVLDQERCILCTRCIRVCDEVAKTHQLEMAQRGDREVLTTAPGHKLDNPYSLNTVDVCPVGALTAKDFRFAMRAWELYTMPSVCPGCATGCNIEVQHSRGQVYRLVPRVNPAVNKHWMCDEGRFTYKRAQTERLVAPMSGGSPVDWDRALDDAGRALSRGARRRRPNQRRRRVQRAVDQRGSLRAGAAGVRSPARRQGVHRRPRPGLERRHPGVAPTRTRTPRARWRSARAGCAACWISPNDLKAGAVTALLVVGTHGVLGRRQGVLGGAAARPAAGAGRDRHAPRRASTAAAHVALPLAEWAEVDGTFTNKLGMVQRVRAAVPPAGDALPGWEILSHLARKLGATMDFVEAKAVFAEAKQKLPFMKDADWGRPMLPVQLRFAELARLTRRPSAHYGSSGFEVGRGARQDPVHDAGLPDAAGVDPHLAGAAAVRDDAGSPRPEPRQHRARHQGGLGASRTSSPTR